jgi:hypothetical protein
VTRNAEKLPRFRWAMLRPELAYCALRYRHAGRKHDELSRKTGSRANVPAMRSSNLIRNFFKKTLVRKVNAALMLRTPDGQQKVQRR